MGTIQTRLTSDNRQHDEAFKKSRQEIYNYNKRVDETKQSVLNFAKNGLGKLGIAFSAAGVAMTAFKKTIQSTQSSADKFDEVMAQSKASVDYFFTSLSRGDFSGFLSGLKNVINTAKEAQQAMDNLQTTILMTSNAGAKYSYERSNLEKIIKTTNDPNERKKAQEQLKTLPETYIKELKIQEKDALAAFYKEAKIAFENAGFTGYNDKLAEEFFSGPVGYNFWSAVYPETLGNITDEPLKKVSDLYKKVYETRQTMNQLYIELVRLQKYGNTGSSSSTTSTTETQSYDEERIRDLDIGYWGNMVESGKYKQGVNWKYTPVIPPEELEEVEENAVKIIHEAEEKKRKDLEKTNEELAKQREIFGLQIDSIYSFSSALGTLGDAFDITGLKTAEIIGVAIANIMKAYSEASAKQAEGSITGWDWLAFSVAGLAQVASVISQLHSLSGYANGGIVGGNSFSGDRVMARVNSGEMILNRSQQANLFNMIGGGVTTGGNVKFRIEGDALVGVLNNYNKKTGRVR